MRRRLPLHLTPYSCQMLAPWTHYLLHSRYCTSADSGGDSTGQSLRTAFVRPVCLFVFWRPPLHPAGDRLDVAVVDRSHLHVAGARARSLILGVPLIARRGGWPVQG